MDTSFLEALESMSAPGELQQFERDVIRYHRHFMRRG